MRKRLNLDLPDLERFSLLAFGPYGGGKTHLQADFLAWAKRQEKGPIAFVNIAGQDGQSSMAGYGLGEVGETVETVKDFHDAMNDWAKGKVFAGAIDGLADYFRIVLKEELGELRYPDPARDGERAKMLWGQLKWRTYQGVLESKAAVPYVMWVCPHDKSEDSIEKKASTTPDLPGKLAFASVGWFDMVGHLTAQPLADRVKRQFNVTPSTNVTVRQRLPKEIRKVIDIPEGHGGWEAIYREVQKAMGGNHA